MAKRKKNNSKEEEVNNNPAVASGKALGSGESALMHWLKSETLF